VAGRATLNILPLAIEAEAAAGPRRLRHALPAAPAVSTEGATDLIDRPMSQHEGALFDAVRVMGTMILDLGGDAKILRARLTSARDTAEGLGNPQTAATLDFLISALFPPPGTPAKPSFKIV
jgi:hypothetical protein